MISNRRRKDEMGKEWEIKDVGISLECRSSRIWRGE